MSTRMNKSYNTIVTMSDDTEIEFTVDVKSEEEQGCMPIVTTFAHTTSSYLQDGMAYDFKEEIREALNEWFKDDACQSDIFDEFSFTFDTITNELTRDVFEEVNDNCASFDDVVEAVKSELSSVSNSDLATIAQQLGLQVEYKGDETFTINRG